MDIIQDSGNRPIYEELLAAGSERCCHLGGCFLGHPGDPGETFAGTNFISKSIAAGKNHVETWYVVKGCAVPASDLGRQPGIFYLKNVETGQTAIIRVVPLQERRGATFEIALGVNARAVHCRPHEDVGHVPQISEGPKRHNPGQGDDQPVPGPDIRAGQKTA